MLRTWLFCTCGGLFAAFYSNAVRRYPLLRKPQTHVLCTLAGFGIGYLCHKYEEGSEERFKQLIKKHPNAPVNTES